MNSQVVLRLNIVVASHPHIPRSRISSKSARNVILFPGPAKTEKVILSCFTKSQNPQNKFFSEETTTTSETSDNQTKQILVYCEIRCQKIRLVESS